MLNIYDTNSPYGLPPSNLKTFTQVFPTVESFIDFYNNCGIPALLKESNSIKTIYYLLCSRYANSSHAGSDETRFKYDLMSTIFQYGTVWEKQFAIQEELRSIDLSSTDWLDGAKSVYNTSLNPATDPANDSFQTLDTINQQNMSLNRKGKLEGLALLYSLLNNNFTDEFLDKFKPLFRKILIQRPLLYENIVPN